MEDGGERERDALAETRAEDLHHNFDADAMRDPSQYSRERERSSDFSCHPSEEHVEQQIDERRQEHDEETQS